MPQIMAILNATPDSFYDGNPHNTAATLLARAETFVQDLVSITNSQIKAAIRRLTGV